VVDVELVLPSQQASIDWLVKGIKNLPRLVLVTRATRGPDAVRVYGEAYWFFSDVSVPRIVTKPPSLDEALAQAGLPADVSAGGPDVVAQMEKARGFFAEMRQQHPAYVKVVEVTREGALDRERLAFFRTRKEAQDNVTEALLFATQAAKGTAPTGTGGGNNG
jgi:hypothetical protein